MHTEGGHISRHLTVYTTVHGGHVRRVIIHCRHVRDASGVTGSRKKSEDIQKTMDGKAVLLFRISHDVRSNISIVQSLTEDMIQELEKEPHPTTLSRTRCTQAAILLTATLLKYIVDSFRFQDPGNIPPRVLKQRADMRVLLNNAVELTRVLVAAAENNIVVYTVVPSCRAGRGSRC